MGSESFLLDHRTRAEDILLGSLGFDQEASIISIRRGTIGYSGIGRWEDGETFEFESDSPLTTLEEWAISMVEELNRTKLKACA